MDPSGPSTPSPSPSPSSVDSLEAGALEPGSADADVREALGAWLALQQRYAWRPQELVQVLRRGAPVAEILRAARVRPLVGAALERALATLDAAGAVLVPFPSTLYPERLRRLEDAPLLLAVRGLPALLCARCVAMVGSRAATAPGRAIARALARDLTQAGLVVVSGLARGIDRASHEGALDGGGFTIAFQACGPEQIYPPEHRELAAAISKRGAVVSELPCGSPPRAPHFPLRNRLISALAEAVIVVEARQASGTLVTARHAADQGVEVMAVPGAIASPTSRGPHQLIREGAVLVERAEDVLRVLGLEGVAGRARTPQPGLPGDIERLLAEAPRTRYELAGALDLALRELAAPLLELELAGRVGRDRDGRLRLLGVLG